MNKVVLGIGLATLVSVATGCLEKSADRGNDQGVFYRHHFVGTSEVIRGTNAAKLKEILQLPSTTNLLGQVLTRLAAGPAEFWAKQLPGDASPHIPLIQPLLLDLVTSESVLELRGRNTQPEFALAVKLNDARAAEWNTNLAQVLTAWKFGSTAPVSGKGYSGWAIKRSAYPKQMQLARAGQWTIFTFGSDNLATAPAWLTTAAEGKPLAALKNNVLLTLNGDLPRLGQWIPPLKSAQLPPVDLVVTGTGEYLRTEGHWRFSQALPIKLEPWRVPTNIINDPIISFSVGQGIAPVLSQHKDIADLGWKTVPNQFCLWSQSTVPWQTYMSLPVPSATNTINGIAPKFPELVFKALGESLGEITWSSNKAELRWGGLPFIIPFLRPARSGNQDFMYFGMFPPLMKTNPPPPELYGQLSARNLVYYDWEITQERLAQVREVWQLYNVIKRRQGASPKWATQQWLMEIAPKLGNTVTELTLSSPKELSLVRRSHVGLTGFELATLIRFIENPGFPTRFEPPPSWSRLKDVQSATNKPGMMPPGSVPPGQRSPTPPGLRTNQPTGIPSAKKP